MNKPNIYDLVVDGMMTTKIIKVIGISREDLMALLKIRTGDDEDKLAAYLETIQAQMRSEGVLSDEDYDFLQDCEKRVKESKQS